MPFFLMATTFVIPEPNSWSGRDLIRTQYTNNIIHWNNCWQMETWPRCNYFPCPLDRLNFGNFASCYSIFTEYQGCYSHTTGTGVIHDPKLYANNTAYVCMVSCTSRGYGAAGTWLNNCLCGSLVKIPAFVIMVSVSVSVHYSELTM